jgi:hypothetical protein
MRNELLASRMRYLTSAVKNLRNLISTKEMSSNQVILKQFELIEWQLKKMEEVYESATKKRSAS